MSSSPKGLVTYGPIIIGFGNTDPDMDGTVHFNAHATTSTTRSIYQPGYSKADVFRSTCVKWCFTE